MKLLLDTHVFLWVTSAEVNLPSKVQKLLEAEENQLLISSASIWETVIKVSSRRMEEWDYTTDLGVLEDWIRDLGAEMLPIRTKHAIAISKLRDWSHKDPFDRMLAAQAISEGAVLVTADAAFQSLADLRCVWNS